MKNIYTVMYSDDNKVDLAKSPRLRTMLKFIDDSNLENTNILDIGCYDCALLALVKNKNNNFYGLDASDYGLSECARKNIQTRKFFWDDQTPLPFPDDFFALAIAGEIIEHIYDTDYFLREIKRVLKKDGRLIISTPNLASLGRRLLLLIGQNPLIESSLSPGNSGHIRYFTFNMLKALLADNGFKISKRASDTVNFSAQGRPSSRMLARLCPSLGQSIIYLAETCK